MPAPLKSSAAAPNVAYLYDKRTVVYRLTGEANNAPNPRSIFACYGRRL